MRRAALRLRICLALLAWFAQLCLPLAHATMMAAPPAQMAGWCGDAARAQAFIAELPAELRQALDTDGSGADPLAACAQLCTVGTTPTPLPALAPTLALRAAGVEPAPAFRPVLVAREPARKPPSQGPPIRG